MKARLLLLAPAALLLGGCMTMGDPVTYGYPTYPVATYPAPTYGYTTPYRGSGQPAVVQPRQYYQVPAPSVSSNDYDGDGVHNAADRFPSDRMRW
jgi:hypothetical protein